MRGRPLVIDWTESADVLSAKYKRERNGHRRARLQALYLLRTGASISAAGQAVGVDYRTVQRWVAWYREGGLNAVLLRTPGYAAPGRPSRLTVDQRAVLLKKARSGQFRTVRDAVDWVHSEFGVTYTYTGMHALLNRSGSAASRTRVA
ncbi:MAG TPA: helix-turn-helix domain-containing protein [Thermomicrobiales bacterium]|nr:helix-turn-helix domain-containing protein [Thermomicrobiales bacterium]